jgi:flagellar protein FliL
MADVGASRPHGPPVRSPGGVQMEIPMAAAAATAADAAPKKGNKKLLIIILAVVLVLVLGGGGAALFLMKRASDKAAAEAAGDEGGGAKTVAHAKVDPSKPPAFVPLDPFVVNLADRDSDRYAQIGITLQVDDVKFGEQMKPFMPAIRNNILMVLAHKQAADLQGRENKEKLAEEIAREAVRPMGIEIDPPEDESEAEAKPKKRKKRVEVHNPVRQVLFSSFIVQ